jgi:hypothetical protein
MTKERGRKGEKAVVDEIMKDALFGTPCLS